MIFYALVGTYTVMAFYMYLLYQIDEYKSYSKIEPYLLTLFITNRMHTIRLKLCLGTGAVCSPLVYFVLTRVYKITPLCVFLINCQYSYIKIASALFVVGPAFVLSYYM